MIEKADLERHPTLAPVLIRQGALGQGLPRRDLRVSRQHRMVLASGPLRNLAGHRTALVAACKLVDLPGIEIETDCDGVAYFHLLLDRHEVIWAEGTPSESLYLGDQACKFLTRAQRAEIAALAPKRHHPALPFLEGSTRKAVVARHGASGRAVLEFLPGSAERVSRPAHGAQRIVAARGHQRLAQPAHMHIHRPAVDIDVAAPDPVKKLLARKDAAGAFHKA